MLSTEQIAAHVNSIDFDHPFILQPGNVLRFDAPGYWAPDVMTGFSESTSDGLYIDKGWEPVTYGLSGQYSYSGPIMHPSEFVGPAVAQRLLDVVEQEECPQVFCLVVVRNEDDHENDAGWMIVRHTGA